MVDQRLDHIDKGKLSPTEPRAYLRRPSVTCTQFPYTPPMAHSRTCTASPCTSGASDAPWENGRVGTPKTSASVAWMSTFVVKAPHVVPPSTPGQCTSKGICPSGSYCMTPGFPQMSFSPR